MIAQDPNVLASFDTGGMWISLADESQIAVWTDQYSNIVSMIKWFD